MTGSFERGEQDTLRSDLLLHEMLVTESETGPERRAGLPAKATAVPGVSCAALHFAGPPLGGVAAVYLPGV